MEHTIEKGIYGKGDVWRFYTVEEAEQHNTKSESWKYIVEQMKDCLGKTWTGRGYEYRIIGLEDNEPYLDYYWILENESGDRIYELANFADFYKNIK
jgi:hypothetical protein